MVFLWIMQEFYYPLFMFRCLNSLSRKQIQSKILPILKYLSISFSKKLSSAEVSFVNEMWTIFDHPNFKSNQLTNGKQYVDTSDGITDNLTSNSVILYITTLHLKPEFNTLNISSSLIFNNCFSIIC